MASRPAERGKLLNLYRGQEVEGEILSITDREITLDLGAKAEGIIATRDIPTPIKSGLKVGGKLKAFVYIQENEHGQIVLSLQKQAPGVRLEGTKTRLRGKSIDWSKFKDAQNQKNKLQGRVIEINKGGLIVEVTGIRGFLPNSQVGFELLTKVGEGPLREARMDNLVGLDLTVTVIEIDQASNKLIFSQRGQVLPETKDKLKSFKPNQKVLGKIVAILPFGLVVDVDGTEGLVFISDVSWEKQEDLSKDFKVGKELEVLVLGLDEELGRLNLSIKNLSEDPFAKVAEDYPADEVVKGTVTSVSDAGVSVKLSEGVEGFLTASKMDTDTKYQEGENMSFLVDSVDIQRRRINLAPFVTSTAGLIYK